VHTWAEAPLACFLVLSALLAAWGIGRAVRGRGAWTGAVGLGLTLGLASATKLTGLVGVAAVVAVGGGLALWLWRQRPGLVSARRVLVWSTVAAVVALAVFVAVNPYLWRDPIGGLGGMLEERRDEMAFQQDQWPEYAVTGWAERPWLTVQGSLQLGPFAETPLAAPVNLPLLAIGLAALLQRIRRRGLALPAVSLLAWAAVYAFVIVAGLGLKYPRYFMPTTLLLLPIVGLGLEMVLRAIWRCLPRRSGPAGRVSAEPRPS
jgi:4-amino-4-deoxy-L-arabinose transferase-like glycosyltransferase